MGFRKYTGSERFEVLSSTDLNKLADTVRGFGKTSASDLTEEEKAELQAKLDKSSE